MIQLRTGNGFITLDGPDKDATGRPVDTTWASGTSVFLKGQAGVKRTVRGTSARLTILTPAIIKWCKYIGREDLCNNIRLSTPRFELNSKSDSLCLVADGKGFFHETLRIVADDDKEIARKKAIKHRRPAFYDDEDDEL